MPSRGVNAREGFWSHGRCEGAPVLTRIPSRNKGAFSLRPKGSRRLERNQGFVFSEDFKTPRLAAACGYFPGRRVVVIRGFLASIWASHEPAGAPRIRACLITALAPITSSLRKVRTPILVTRPGIDTLATMYVIDRAKKADLNKQWSLPDRVFFACGACQVLAYATVQQFAPSGFKTIWIKPGASFRVNHIITTDGDWAFDYHGWSKLDRLLKHTQTKAARWWPGWTFTLVDIPPPVLISEQASKDFGCHMRQPDQFLHNALPRAEAFLASKQPPF